MTQNYIFFYRYLLQFKLGINPDKKVLIGGDVNYFLRQYRQHNEMRSYPLPKCRIIGGLSDNIVSNANNPPIIMVGPFNLNIIHRW